MFILISYAFLEEDEEIDINKIERSIENTDCETDVFGQFDSPVESSQQTFAPCLIRIFRVDADHRQAGRGYIDVRRPR